MRKVIKHKDRLFWIGFVIGMLGEACLLIGMVLSALKFSNEPVVLLYLGGLLLAIIGIWFALIWGRQVSKNREKLNNQKMKS